MDDLREFEKTLVILWNKQKTAFVSLYRDRNIHDSISTRKISETTRLSRLLLVFSDIFPIKMTSFKFLSKHRDSRTNFHLLIKSGHVSS